MATTRSASSGRVISRRAGGRGWAQFASVDLSFILEKFEQEAPPREVFTLTEVAQMTQEESPTVHAWVKAGVLAPSVRDRDGTRGRAMLFSRLDAFVACLVASLKRKCGLPLSKLKGISDVLKAVEPPQPRSRRVESSETTSSHRTRPTEKVTK